MLFIQPFNGLLFNAPNNAFSAPISRTENSCSSNKQGFTMPFAVILNRLHCSQFPPFPPSTTENSPLSRFIWWINLTWRSFNLQNSLTSLASSSFDDLNTTQLIFTG